jgi:signal transduction histidine kinase
VDLDRLVLAEADHLRGSTDLLIETTGVSAARMIGDRMTLAGVVRRLGESAARHARRRVRFTTKEANGRVTLVVEDDGPGPDGDPGGGSGSVVRPEATGTATSDGGALGLAIVEELVRGLGGQLTAGTGALGGARIVVDLPGED